MQANNAEAARLIKRYNIKNRSKRIKQHWTKESYQEYLNTDLWKTRRQRALVKAMYACQICKSTHRLEVHHNTYDRLGEELDSDLLVVCENHHRMIHGRSFSAEINY